MSACVQPSANSLFALSIIFSTSISATLGPNQPPPVGKTFHQMLMSAAPLEEE